MTMNYARVEDILRTLAAEDLQNRSVLVIDSDEKRAELLPIETAKSKAVSFKSSEDIHKYLVDFKLANFIIISNMKLKADKITRNSLEFENGDQLDWQSDFYIEFNGYMEEESIFAKPLLSVEDVKEKRYEITNENQKRMKEVIDSLDKYHCHIMMNTSEVVDKIRSMNYIKLDSYDEFDISKGDIIIDAYDYRVGSIDDNTCIIGDKLYRYEISLNTYVTNKEVNKSLSSNNLIVFTDGTCVFENLDGQYDFTIDKINIDEYIELMESEDNYDPDQYYDDYYEYISDLRLVYADHFLLDYSDYYKMPYPDDHMLYNMFED